MNDHSLYCRECLSRAIVEFDRRLLCGHCLFWAIHDSNGADAKKRIRFLPQADVNDFDYLMDLRDRLAIASRNEIAATSEA